MKLGVVGSKHYQNKGRVFHEINELRKKYKIDTIVSGGAKGADTFGENYADEMGLKKIIFPADWYDFSEPCLKKINSFGKEFNALAGFKRNTTIVEYSDKIIAFWDNKSHGTKDTIEKALQKGIEVIIIKF